MLTPDQNRARRDHINLHKTMKYALTIIIVLTASLFTQACNRKPEEPITTATNNTLRMKQNKPSDDNDAVKATDSKPASENDKVIKDDSEIAPTENNISNQDINDTHNNEAQINQQSKEITDEDRVILEKYKNAHIIKHDHPDVTLTEPFTLTQLKEKLKSEKLGWKWDAEEFRYKWSAYDDDPNWDSVMLYDTEKNSKGKAYLIGVEKQDGYARFAEIYIGIRDFDNNKMIVNFYSYGVEIIDQYGTTFETNRNFSISKLKKIDGYLKIDINVLTEILIKCTPDDYDYDDDGNMIEASCEIEEKHETKTVTYLYR